MEPSLRTSISAAAVLDDELRSSMYFYIRRARRPITRDEAAASVGISRKLAAFHLDKLVAAGLLRADYEAVGGVRRVGRTPKVYRPTEAGIRVEIPRRSGDLLTEVLLEVVLTESEGEHATDAVLRAARECGERLAVKVRPGGDALTGAVKLLSRHGFEPYRSAACVRLRNCPFHPLAARAPDLVCGLNHAFLTGCVAGTDVRAAFSPRAGECCVELRAPSAEDG